MTYILETVTIWKDLSYGFGNWSWIEETEERRQDQWDVLCEIQIWIEMLASLARLIAVICYLWIVLLHCSVDLLSYSRFSATQRTFTISHSGWKEVCCSKRRRDALKKKSSSSRLDTSIEDYRIDWDAECDSVKRRTFWREAETAGLRSREEQINVQSLLKRFEIRSRPRKGSEIIIPICEDCRIEIEIGNSRSVVETLARRRSSWRDFVVWLSKSGYWWQLISILIWRRITIESVRVVARSWRWTRSGGIGIRGRWWFAFGSSTFFGNLG